MKPKRITLALIASMVLALAAMVSLAGAAQPVVSEVNLNPSGAVYEVNADAHGNLWISDYQANQIWQMNPSTGQYTIYQNLNKANDAQMDVSGNVWWTDYGNGYLGRIAPGTHALTQWLLSGGAAPSPLGVAFDNAGHVWAADDKNAQLFRLDPASNQVCVYSYTVGTGVGVSSEGNGFINWAGGSIWISNGGGGSIISINPASNSGKLWQLALGRVPQEFAVDASGQVWFAEPIESVVLLNQRSLPLRRSVDRGGSIDRGASLEYVTSGALARLQPSTNQLTEYMLPVDTYPQALYLNGTKVWYTANQTVGIMDSTAAVGASSTLTQTTFTVTPSCSTVAPSSSSITTVTGTAVWTSKTYLQSVNNSAWQVYQMPVGASPWGITGFGNNVWVTDQGRQTLAQFANPFSMFIPMLYR
jgi:streptogramin lyase